MSVSYSICSFSSRGRVKEPGRLIRLLFAMLRHVCAQQLCPEVRIYFVGDQHWVLVAPVHVKSESHRVIFRVDRLENEGAVWAIGG